MTYLTQTVIVQWWRVYSTLPT